MDQIKAIECFLAVAHTGSFSRAADRLQRPISSISRQVTALETALSAQLLIRSTRRVHLTEIGRFYQAQCRDILAQLNNASEQVTSYQSEPSGTLTISAMTSFGERMLVPLIEQLQDRYPKIVVDAEFTDKVQDLSVEGIDLCFRGGPLPDKRLIAHKLMDNEFHLCATPAYLQQHGTPQDIASLERHYAIYYRGPNGKMPWWVDDEQGQRQCYLPPALITNSSQLMIAAILQGKGVSMMPMWALEPYLERGELVQIVMANPPRILLHNTLGIYLLYQQSRYLIPKVRCAVDFFRQSFATRA